MGLDNMGTKIYTIHGYFRGLTVGQQTPKFLGCHIPIAKILDRLGMCAMQNVYAYVRKCTCRLK